MRVSACVESKKKKPKQTEEIKAQNTKMRRWRARMRRLAFNVILATSLTHAPTATMVWRPPNTAHIGCENEKELSSVASWLSKAAAGKKPGGIIGWFMVGR